MAMIYIVDKVGIVIRYSIIRKILLSITIIGFLTIISYFVVGIFIMNLEYGVFNIIQYTVLFLFSVYIPFNLYRSRYSNEVIHFRNNKKFYFLIFIFIITYGISLLLAYFEIVMVNYFISSTSFIFMLGASASIDKIDRYKNV